MAGTYYRTMSPNARLDFTLDFAADPWLPTGDRLTSCTWATNNAKLTASGATRGSTSANIFLETTAAAVEGEIYEATGTFRSFGGRRERRTIRVFIRNK